MKSRKVDRKSFERAAIKLHRIDAEFKEAKAKYEAEKVECENIIGTYFDQNDLDECDANYDGTPEGLNVKKIQRVRIKFDPDKLEKMLGRNMSKKVIKKNYSIINMDGLICYLKKCGVDPKVFKTYISVTKVVQQDALDQLEETGQIDIEQIEGSFTVSKDKPYFKIR